VLFQNYPNPFNPSTVIRFSLPEQKMVHLVVYDVLGREAAILINKEMEAGSHILEFDGTGFPSGVYFYSIRAGEFSVVKKFILLK
jgi:hypothetical protein